MHEASSIMNLLDAMAERLEKKARREAIARAELRAWARTQAPRTPPTEPPAPKLPRVFSQEKWAEFIEAALKMRHEQGMGWQEIGRKLGVHDEPLRYKCQATGRVKPWMQCKITRATQIRRGDWSWYDKMRAQKMAFSAIARNIGMSHPELKTLLANRKK